MPYELTAVIGIGLLTVFVIARFGAEIGKLVLPLAVIFGIVVAKGM